MPGPIVSRDDSWRAVAERIVGAAITDTRPLAGGCIGDVHRLTFAGAAPLVAKVGAPGSGQALEGWMLDYLMRHSALPVPRVHHADDMLLLVTLLPSDGALDAAAEADAAGHLAALHSVTGHAFGLERDTLIGGLDQPNGQMASSGTPSSPSGGSSIWPARQRPPGGCRRRRRARIEARAGRLDRWLDEPAAPALIHGDMWGGNVLCRRTAPGADRGNRIAGFIDPAIYYADPEVELAFATLFNTFGEAFFARYREVRPLAPGFFKARRDLYNLYPLLVHVRLFGGGYLGAVERTLRRFGA